MADIAYNVTSNKKEKIVYALIYRNEGKSYEYLCNDEFCPAKMFVRGGQKPSFFASKFQGHRVGCSFENRSKSSEEPPTDVKNWYDELLSMGNLPKEKGNGSKTKTTKSKGETKLSYTAQSIYRLQCGLESTDYIDKSGTMLLGNFVISPRTKHYHSKGMISGLHLIIGTIKLHRFDKNESFILCHINTKGRTEKPIRVRINLDKEVSWQIYNDIKTKYGVNNTLDRDIAFLTYLEEDEGSVDLKSTSSDRESTTFTYKYSCKGRIIINRQFYIL